MLPKLLKRDLVADPSNIADPPSLSNLAMHLSLSKWDDLALSDSGRSFEDWTSEHAQNARTLAASILPTATASGDATVDSFRPTAQLALGRAL